MEKAIKGLVVALKFIEPTRDHEVTEELKQLGLFSLNPKGKANRVYAKRVSQIFGRSANRLRIRDLVQLRQNTPKRMNWRGGTRISVSNAAGEWKIPADADVFSAEELNQFRQTASLVVRGASEIAIARQLKITL